MDLYLIRHPEPDVAEGTCYGRSDIGLLGDPAREAARIARLLPVDAAVFTSPLRRCRRLAERLSPAAVVEKRLVEMDFGDWEMRPWESIDPAVFQAWIADLMDFVPPGGEAAATMLARTLDFLDELAPRPLPAAALVTHGGVLRVLFTHWLGMPVERMGALVFEFGAVSKVSLGPAGLRVAYVNRR